MAGRSVCKSCSELFKQTLLEGKAALGVSHSRYRSTAPAAALQNENGGLPSADVKPFSAIPGPKGLPVVGTLFEVLRQKAKNVNTYDLIEARFREHGPIFKEKIGSLSMVYVKDPGALESMLRLESKHPRRIIMEPWVSWREDNHLPKGVLIEDGPDWRRMRSIMDQRMLRPKNVAAYTTAFNEVTSDFVAHMRRVRDEKGEGVTVLNLDQELFRWSLETIGTVLYETRFGAFSDNANPEIGEFIDAVNRMFGTTENVIYYPKFLRKILIPKKHKEHEDTWATIFHVGGKVIDAKVVELESQMSAGKEISGGFLSFLLAEGKMSRAEIYSNISELMLAAVDTTSNTMQWVMYELARNPQIQDKMRQEVDHVTKGQEPTNQHLQNMPYLKGVIKEILRIYPIAATVARILDRDQILMGYHLPKDTTVLGSTFAMGRDPTIYEDPLTMKPERWQRDEQKKPTHSFAFLPFGFGTRACIGKRVAELEMQLLLTRITQTFYLEPMNNKSVNISSRGLLVPERAVEVKFIDRN